jgi:hypothetical protein
MRHLLVLLCCLILPDDPPRVEVKGVEVSGVWLRLAARSHVTVYLRGPEGLRLISPDSSDSSTTRVALDSGAASVQLAPLPAGAMTPVNCVVTPRDIFRWDPASQTAERLKGDDCGPLPPSASGPGRPIPGKPGQGPGDSWYIPRPNDASDRHHYLIVIATDGDAPPPDAAKALDDRLRGVPALYAAQKLGETLGRGPDWAAVVVRLGR